MIGQTISHYKMLEKLGGGGMGVVYKAQDLKLDRFVALKFLPPDLTREPEGRERFIHEAKAASALQHPNICTIHDIDETADNQLFIVMDCYEGDTLRQKIERGPLKLEEACDLALQVGQGLSEAHAHGIVHRDVKPANILVTKSGVARIVDFGLAKLSGQTMLTKSGSTVGTAAYMSPEQARGGKVDQRTDIWSLGVVLFEMLTGKKPFESEYEQALVYLILNQEPRPMRELRPEVPEAIEKICRRAMAKERKDRYQSAAELISDLASYRAGTQLALKTRKVISKRRRLVYAVLVVIVVAIALFGIFYKSMRGEVFDRVAVLPFHNLSKDSTQEYLADGMTEEVIARLQHVASLNVPSIRGTLKFKGSQSSYVDIARELHAKALVDASILFVGNRVRIIAKLIDPATDRSLWSETYDGSMEEILELQSRIARALVSAVRVEVTHNEATRLSRSQRVDPRAYELYLKARHSLYIAQGDEQKFRMAVNILEQAIAIDSTCPAFYALAVNYYQVGAFAGYYTPVEVIPRMQRAAEKAIALDDQSSDSQKALSILDQAKWDWKGAEAAFRRGIEISPGDADIQSAFGWLLVWIGKFDEAVMRMNQASEMDASMDPTASGRVIVYMFSRRYDDAVRVGVEYARRFPDDPLLLCNLSWAFAEKGSCDSAISYALRSYDRSGHDSFMEVNCAQIYGICGQRQKALEFLDHYFVTQKGKTIEPYQVAATYAILHDTSNAYSWLDRAYREKSQGLGVLNIDPSWDFQRSSPRYRDMLRRIGLDN
jgi:serine/threonine protein kinase